MFEKWVANLLNQWLGSFVHESCFRAERVKTSVYSGHVNLTELELKKSAVEIDGFVLRKGFIGSAEFKIPWNRLGSKPLELWLDKVYLLLGPDLEYSEEKFAKKQHASKVAKLAAAELLKRQFNAEEKQVLEQLGVYKQVHEGDEEVEMAAAGNYTSRLFGKVMDNAELHVRNVHVRFVDECQTGNDPVTVGFMFDSLEAKSTDENWRPCFIDLRKELERRMKEVARKRQVFSYKAIRCKQFAIYCRATTQAERRMDYARASFGDVQALFAQHEQTLFKQRLKQSSKSAARFSSKDSYLLCPVTVDVHVKSNRDPRFKDSPKTIVEVEVDKLSVALYRDQYEQLLELYSDIEHRNRRNRNFKAYRPQVPCSRHAQAWWRFAIRAVLEDIRERKHRYTGSYITQRRR